MKRLLAALVAVFLCSQAYAANLAPQGPFRALDGNGDPCAACKLYTYEAGTTTNKTTYTDNTEASNNTNPVILDSDGYADVWLGDGAYKFVLKDSNDATLWTLDNITGSAAGAFGDTVASLAANTSITTAYENNLILTTSSPTLSLLSAATAGEGFTFAVKNTDTGTTTIDPFGSETIDGSLTLGLGEDQWAIVYSDGTNWVTTSTILADGSITTAKLADDSVTLAKLDGDDGFADMLIGYSSAGDPANISVSGLTLDSSTLSMPIFDDFHSGLVLSNDTDADHDILVGSGIAADSTNADYLNFSSGLTKQIDATWAAGNAAGGLFSGTVANNTWYHVFIIEKDSDGTIDAGFDTSVTAANIPSGYTKYRRIGSVLTDGSANIIGFTQLGNRFLWDTPVNDQSATNPGTSARLVTLTVPTGVKVQPIGSMWIDTITLGGGVIYGLATSPDQSDTAPSSTVSNYAGRGSGSTQYAISHGSMGGLWTNTSGQIRFRISASDANTSERIMTQGWIDLTL